MNNTLQKIFERNVTEHKNRKGTQSNTNQQYTVEKMQLTLNLNVFHTNYKKDFEKKNKHLPKGTDGKTTKLIKTKNDYIVIQNQ